MTVYLWFALPAVVMLLGGWLASFWKPSGAFISSVQHVAAGIILAAITIEVFPEMNRSAVSPWSLVAMFTCGVGFMFGVKRLGEWLEGRARRRGVAATVNFGFVITVFLDAALDGLTIGAGFAAGEKVGLALAIGLSAEMLFLGMSLVSETIHGRRVLALSAAMAAVLLGAAVLGYRVLSQMPASAVSIALAFSAAALLYLVTEELLIEAHAAQENQYSMLLLFAGFIAFWIVSLA